MKIVQEYENEKEKFVLDIFKKTISSFYYQWNLERLIINFSFRNSVELKENEGIITFDKTNKFIQSKDELSIRALILESLMELVLLRSNIKIICKSSLEEVAKQTLIDRLLVKNFGDVIFHRNLITIRNLDLNKEENWIEANLRTYVFYKIDNWLVDYLERFLLKLDKEGRKLLGDEIKPILDEFDESEKKKENFEEAIKKLAALS